MRTDSPVHLVQLLQLLRQADITYENSYLKPDKILLKQVRVTISFFDESFFQYLPRCYCPYLSFLGNCLFVCLDKFPFYIFSNISYKQIPNLIFWAYFRCQQNTKAAPQRLDYGAGAITFRWVTGNQSGNQRQSQPSALEITDSELGLLLHHAIPHH
jgi:hypothetical protein